MRNKFQHWLYKRQKKARPDLVTSKVRVIVHKLGEFTRLSEPRKEGPPTKSGTPPLPPAPPEDGYLYEDDELRLEVSDRNTCRVFWLGKCVYTSYMGATDRFNYGEAWLRAIDELHDDIQSKKRRANQAKWCDLEEDK